MLISVKFSLSVMMMMMLWHDVMSAVFYSRVETRKKKHKQFKLKDKIIFILKKLSNKGGYRKTRITL